MPEQRSEQTHLLIGDAEGNLYAVPREQLDGFRVADENREEVLKSLSEARESRQQSAAAAAACLSNCRVC